jgi:hypothetical protein
MLKTFYFDKGEVMKNWGRIAGITLAVVLSYFALPSSAAAVRFCYCELYCSDGSVIFGQAQTRAECNAAFQEYCGGSGQWVCPYQ